MHTFCSDNYGWLLGWLRRRVGDPFDAADLMQDTFVRVLKTHTGRFCAASTDPAAAIGKPRAYLATIAQSLMIDFPSSHAGANLSRGLGRTATAGGAFARNEGRVA